MPWRFVLIDGFDRHKLVRAPLPQRVNGDVVIVRLRQRVVL